MWIPENFSKKHAVAYLRGGGRERGRMKQFILERNLPDEHLPGDPTPHALSVVYSHETGSHSG